MTGVAFTVYVDNEPSYFDFFYCPNFNLTFLWPNSMSRFELSQKYKTKRKMTEKYNKKKLHVLHQTFYFDLKIYFTYFLVIDFEKRVKVI